MKGPLQRIRDRRAAPGTAALQGAAANPTAQPTAVLPPATGVEPVESGTVPAGAEAVPSQPSFRTRGRMRRRLRYLRRARELGLRDLGGLLFDQHRFARPDEALLSGKLEALSGVDRELRELELALDDRRPLTELREPGVSVCARCGALHPSDARFCSSCGAARAIAGVGEAVTLPSAATAAPPAAPGPQA
jgi:ribosomal protein L40E